MRASRGGGGACSLVPCENLQLFPCSSKINEGVPLNSLLLSSHVPRNSAPCSLDHQKYSSLFPTIPLILYFFMVSYFHRFSLVSHSTDTPRQNASRNERNCNTLPIFCRRNGLFFLHTKKVFPMVRKSMFPCSRL